MIKTPIRVWREPVDDKTRAVVAFVEFVFRGGYHAASTFVLVGVNDYRWRAAGEAALREHVATVHHGHVPYLRRVRDDHAPAISKRQLLADDGDDGRD